MKIVGVSSCSIGIAHTYMAAESVEKFFGKLGHEVKMERDGSLGPENPITEEEIAEADAIVLALDGDLDSPWRFEGYEEKTVEVSASVALRDPGKIKDLLIEKGLYKE